ncbi:MAG: YihY/virulence factor BrkB family protein [Bacteroidota bacterium]
MDKKLMLKDKIIAWVLKIPFVKFILDVSKELSIPGFSHIPIYYVLSFFIKGLFKGDLTQRSAALSFTFFLALFPAIIGFFTLIPYVPIDNFQATLLNTLSDIIPQTTWDVIGPIITDIISRQRGSLLSISFIMALLLASNGIMGITKAFNNSYHAIDSRPPLKQRLISLLLIAIISVLIVTAIGLIIGGKILIGYLMEQEMVQSGIGLWMLFAGRWIIVMGLMFMTISFIYYLAPANQKYYKFISAGSTLSTLMALLLMAGFDVYISNFTHYNVLYGSIGTLIAMMVFLYFNSMVLLIGFELNVSIYQARKSYKQN